MQTLTYQNDSDITQGVMINRAQARSVERQEVKYLEPTPRTFRQKVWG